MQKIFLVFVCVSIFACGLVTAGGNRRYIPCELIVFTGDWIPDHALARTAGLAIDAGTRGPAVDTTLATSADGVFAAGNLVHAAETADIAALSGRHAARQIATYLSGNRGGARVPVEVAAPLLWISPNAVTPGSPPPLGRFTLRTAQFDRPAALVVRQDGRLLARFPRSASPDPRPPGPPQRQLAPRHRPIRRPHPRRRIVLTPRRPPAGPRSPPADRQGQRVSAGASAFGQWDS